MRIPDDRLDIKILLNLKNEIRNFDQNPNNCLITQWFKTKNVNQPCDSKRAFTNAERFIGRDSSANYSGPGIMIYPSNRLYSKAFIGNFVMGKRQGEGVRMVLNKLYIGNYTEDRKHGSAQIWDLSNQGQGKIFEGFYKHGLMNGQCFFKDSNHEFMGQMENGLYNGQCSILYSNGDKFEGEMKNGVMDGYGTITYKNGDVFQGNLKNNEMTGNGKYIWAKVEQTNYNTGFVTNNYGY